MRMSIEIQDAAVKIATQDDKAAGAGEKPHTTRYGNVLPPSGDAAARRAAVGVAVTRALELHEATRGGQKIEGVPFEGPRP